MGSPDNGTLIELKKGWIVTLAPLSNRMISSLADMNEYELFVRDAAQVELRVLSVAQTRG